MGRLLDEDIVIDALIGISGSKSIEELTEECEVYQSDNRCWSGGVYGAIRTIKALTSVQPKQQWIPVSERLPEEDGKYMVTIHGYTWNGKTFTSVSVAECIGKRWVGNNGVIAWMPLPEAYKPNNE